MKQVELENFVVFLKGLCEVGISEIKNEKPSRSEFINGYSAGTLGTYKILEVMLLSLENGVFDYEIQDEKQSCC